MATFKDYDPYTGITETFYQEKIGGIIKVNKSQDTEALTDINKIERNQARTGWKETFHKVASIPLIVIDIWREELKLMSDRDPNPLAKSNQQWFIAKLNSNDYLKLRTKEGVL